MQMAVWVRARAYGVISPALAAAVRPRVAAVLVGGLLLTAATVAAVGAIVAGHGATIADAEVLRMEFEAHALGAVEHQVPVTDQPGGGRELARLVPGASVQIGGQARSGRILPVGKSYWIRWQGGGTDVYGFVAAWAVRVEAGEVPRLESTGPAARSPNGSIDIEWLPTTVTAWAPLLETAGASHGVDPELLAIVLLVESGGNPRAGSHAGARGLMQVMPATGTSIAVERGIVAFDPAELYEPATCIDFGAYYLAQQLRAFGRRDDPDWQYSVRLAAAAYNGGPGNARSGTWPSETRSYVKWVGGMWSERHQPDSPTYREWLAAGGYRLVQSAQQQLAMR
jgi:hypothetical protein